MAFKQSYIVYCLKEYTVEKSTYCTDGGNGKIGSDLQEAKSACSQDINCIGFYDDCGEHENFFECNTPIDAWSSGCGSILYRKRK